MSTDSVWYPLSILSAQPGTRALYVADWNPGEWYCKPVMVWALLEEMQMDDYGRIAEASDKPGYRHRTIKAMVLDGANLKDADARFDDDGIRFEGILQPGEPMPDLSDLARWEAAKKRLETREKST
jgi:hypothetical protein